MNQAQTQAKPARQTVYEERNEESGEEEPNPNQQTLARPGAQSQALQRKDDRGRMTGPPRLLSDDFYGTWFDEQRRWEMQQQGSGGGQDISKEDTLRLRLDLNLDIEVKLRAHLHGDLTLALLCVTFYRSN
jgi:hypothetical protein